MRPGRYRAALAIATLSGAAAVLSPAMGQEPGFFGRLFRGGSSTAPRTAPVEPSRSIPELEALPPGETPAPPPVTPIEAGPGLSGGTAAPEPRLIPQPRVSRAMTEADPIVTRITLGRSNEGRTFGMFLQVFADGTVIDSDGPHALGREAVRGVVEALQSGEPFRVRGHCGGPPTDFVEQVQMTVFERSLGRLRANSFSFSGNTQGCDPSIRRLQTALDALQARISPAVSAAGTTAAASPVEVAPPVANAPAPAVIAPAPPPPVIRLNEEP